MLDVTPVNCLKLLASNSLSIFGSFPMPFGNFPATVALGFSTSPDLLLAAASKNKPDSCCRRREEVGRWRHSDVCANLFLSISFLHCSWIAPKQINYETSRAHLERCQNDSDSFTTPSALTHAHRSIREIHRNSNALTLASWTFRFTPGRKDWRCLHIDWPILVIKVCHLIDSRVAVSVNPMKTHI